MEWFKLGGWGMYPILILGLVTLGSSAFFAARGETRIRRSIDDLCKALFGAIVTAFASDLIAVCFFLSKKDTPDTTHLKFLYEGVGESLTTITMGSAFFTLIYIFVAIGQRKADQRV